MIDYYPELGPTIPSTLKSALHEIGFTGWQHLRKDKRDGKIRLAWTFPIDGCLDWFYVVLVKVNDHLEMDFITNPLGQELSKTDIDGLIYYIKCYIIK
jgi:hypothetical protein